MNSMAKSSKPKNNKQSVKVQNLPTSKKTLTAKDMGKLKGGGGGFGWDVKKPVKV